MASKIQIRRDTASNWTSADPTLSNGELGLETDTKKLKAGDGSTAWTSLAYYTLATAGYAAYADTTANFTGTLQEGGSNVVCAGDLGTNVATFLGTPSSANLASAVTDETGSGALAFATSPTFVTPALGTPSALVATNATGTAASLTAGVSTLTNALKSATTTVSVSSATAPTTGQILTATGASAATWQAPAAGGTNGWHYLSTVTASTSSTVDVETTFDSTYDAYVIVASGVTVSNSSINVLCRLKLGGSYDTAGYFYHVDNTDSSSTSYVGIAAVNASSITLAQSPNSGTTGTMDFVMFVNNPDNTAFFKRVKWLGAFLNGGQSPENTNGSGHVKDVTDALTGVRFFPSSGTIVAGTFRLYGIANS